MPQSTGQRRGLRGPPRPPPPGHGELPSHGCPSSPAAPSEPFRTVGRSEVTQLSQCPKPETPTRIPHLDLAWCGHPQAHVPANWRPRPEGPPPAINGGASSGPDRRPPPPVSPATHPGSGALASVCESGEQRQPPPSPLCASPRPRAQAPRELAGGLVSCPQAGRHVFGEALDSPRDPVPISSFTLRKLFR